MNKKNAILFLTLFGLTIIFSVWGIVQLSKADGPCNAGIAFIVLVPAMIAITILQCFILNYVAILASQKNESWASVSFFIALVWVFFMKLFSDDKHAILYLSPFLIFNVLVTLFILLHKQTNIRKTGKSN
jgi:hypothetical protein